MKQRGIGIRARAFAPAVLLLAVGLSTAAEGDPLSGIDAVYVTVEGAGSERAAIEGHVLARLRAAGIGVLNMGTPIPQAPPILTVRLSPEADAEGGYRVDVSLRQAPASASWSSPGSASAASLLDAVDAQLDRFIQDQRAANPRG